MEFVTQAYSTARRAAQTVRELSQKKEYSYFANASGKDRSGAIPIPCSFTISGCWTSALDE